MQILCDFVSDDVKQAGSESLDFLDFNVNSISYVNLKAMKKFSENSRSLLPFIWPVKSS